MIYYVYMIEGPTEKIYVGLSKNVKERWRSHCNRAFKTDRRHPLYDAMRKYGVDAFKVTVLGSYLTLEDAQAGEIAMIACLGTNVRSIGYNISKGGEYDALVGPKIFWDRMRSDPVAFEKYRASLRAGQAIMVARTGGHERAKGFLTYRAAQSSRDLYYASRRALRLAGTVMKHAPETGRLKPSGPKSAALLHAMRSRQNALAQWANRTDEQIRDVGDKISSSLKNRVATDPEYAALQQERILKARNAVDRDVQGAAASKGLKNFWIEIRKDPERYEAYMQSRNDSLRKTLAKKYA